MMDSRIIPERLAQFLEPGFAVPGHDISSHDPSFRRARLYAAWLTDQSKRRTFRYLGCPVALGFMDALFDIPLFDLWRPQLMSLLPYAITEQPTDVRRQAFICATYAIRVFMPISRVALGGCVPNENLGTTIDIFNAQGFLQSLKKMERDERGIKVHMGDAFNYARAALQKATHEDMANISMAGHFTGICARHAANDCVNCVRHLACNVLSVSPYIDEDTNGDHIARDHTARNAVRDLVYSRAIDCARALIGRSKTELEAADVELKRIAWAQQKKLRRIVMHPQALEDTTR